MLKKKSFRVLVLIAALVLVGGISFKLLSCASTSKLGDSQAQMVETPANAVAELTFTYTRLSGFSSNQFAVWIEDENEQYIKTIYATRFTANGGWKKRETSLPLWVKRSNLSEKEKAQIDILTSATPKQGNLKYIWDGTNNVGEVVSEGNYTIILEATLRGENQVYYRASIQFGQGLSDSEVIIIHIGDAGADRAMIDDVAVRVLR